MEPSPGIGLGRPVKRALQFSDLVCFSGPSHWHSPALPRTSRVNEAAALPSPAVVLSARLKQYYGRLRLPPGTRHFPTSAGYRTATLRPPTPQGARAGEGLPSSRHHHPNVPRPLRRGVLRGCASRLFTPSMAFTHTGARLSLVPPYTFSRRGRLRLTLRTARSHTPTGCFDAALRPRPFPPEAGSLLPGLLAATRTGLPPAGDDELVVESRCQIIDLQQSGRTPVARRT